MKESVSILESFRDAIQGIKRPIPTKAKVDYLNTLINCGFDIVEAGSFVSPQAVPQMSDTAEVLKTLNCASSKSSVMVLVANLRGAQEACGFSQVNMLSYPFSASETFLKLNTGTDYDHGLQTTECLLELCYRTQKELVVYVTMAFGNPYNDKWSVQKVVDICGELFRKGAIHLALSDIMGEASPETISNVLKTIYNAFPGRHFRLHLHSLSNESMSKIDSAWNAGYRSFDSVLTGLGGCPMTGKELVSNIDTLELLKFLNGRGIDQLPDENKLREAAYMLKSIIVNNS